MVQTQVGRVMGAITSLESSLESVETRASEMQKSLGVKAGAESSRLLEAVRELAGRESDAIVSAARAKAESESKKIKQKGADTASQIQTNIDANFDGAVEYVVSEILKE